jgi:hypothetical protein
MPRSPEATRSIDERLAVLAHLIHTWDWRSGVVAETKGLERSDMPRTPAPLRQPPSAADHRRERPSPPPPAAQVRVAPPIEQAHEARPRIEPRRAAPPRVEPERVIPPRVAQTHVASPRVEETRVAPPRVEETRVAPPRVEETRVAPPRVEQERAFPSNVVEPTLLSPMSQRDAPLRTPAWQWAQSTTTTPVLDAPRPSGPGTSDVAVDDPATATESASLDEDPTDESLLPGSRWIKPGLWLAAVIVVVVIVAVIRMNAPGATSGSLTPTTVTHQKSPVAHIPVSTTTKAAFLSASNRLNVANVTVTQELASSSGQSVAQIAQEITPYVTALNTFEFTLRFIAWPGAMQVPSQDLALRTQALATFLPSISSANAATLPSWVAQFHVLASRAEAAANLVRRDIGLRSTNSYP